MAQAPSSQFWRYIDTDLYTQRLPDGQQAANLLASAAEHYSHNGASVSGAGYGGEFHESDEFGDDRSAYDDPPVCAS